MTNEKIELKDLVELPAQSISMKVGRAAVTERVPVTEYTRENNFAESQDLLSEKPLKRPVTRKLSKLN
jgi:hypothetical protein